VFVVIVLRCCYFRCAGFVWLFVLFVHFLVRRGLSVACWCDVWSVFGMCGWGLSCIRLSFVWLVDALVSYFILLF